MTPKQKMADQADPSKNKSAQPTSQPKPEASDAFIVRVDSLELNSLTEDDKALIKSVSNDSHIRTRVETILTSFNQDLKDLTDGQKREHVLGVINLHITLNNQRKSLEELDWYKGLDPDGKQDVQRTLEMNFRIQSATLRTIRRADEDQIQKTNPWSYMLKGQS